MKRFVFILASQVMAATLATAQNPIRDIQERIWQLNEFYVDSTLHEDALYVYFSNDNQFVSNRASSRLTTYRNVRIMNGSQGTYEYQAPGAGNVEQLRIDDSGEVRDFRIAYRDRNNLVLVSYDTIPGRNLVSGQDYVYPVELRLIPLE